MKPHDHSQYSQNRSKSLPPSTPGPDWISSLVRTCRSAIEESEPEKLVHSILTGALRTIGAETAFLVTSDERRDPVVQASVPNGGPPGDHSPSKTILRSALVCRSPRVWLDVRTTRIFTKCESIQQMGIRSVLAAPVRWSRHPSAALVLDTRMDRMTRFDWMPDLLGLYASLLGSAFERLPVPAILQHSTETTAPQAPLAGRSELFREMLGRIRRYARCRLPILIHGETGTGKEGAARMIHDLGPRRHAPFHAVNCAAVPETLLEAELFGARKGAYTGADADRTGIFRQADGGTLLLDEIGDMPMPMQAKLLRVLQEGKVRPLGGDREIPADVRVLAATHRNIQHMVEDGRFRADLYHRLAVLKLEIPPLRRRLEDLPVLIRHMSSRLQEAAASPPPELSSSGVQALQSHSWPGNIRELESVLARAMIEAQGRTITADILEFDPVLTPGGNSPPRLPTHWSPPLEISFLQAVISDSCGNLPHAAARIGWSRQKLYRRMQTLKMDVSGQS